MNLNEKSTTDKSDSTDFILSEYPSSELFYANITLVFIIGLIYWLLRNNFAWGDLSTILLGLCKHNSNQETNSQIWLSEQ